MKKVWGREGHPIDLFTKMLVKFMDVSSLGTW